MNETAKYEWKQVDGDIWVSEVNIEQGTIKVTSKNTGKIIIERKGLSEKVMKVVMDNFLGVVGKKVEMGTCDDMMYR